MEKVPTHLGANYSWRTRTRTVRWSQRSRRSRTQLPAEYKITGQTRKETPYQTRKNTAEKQSKKEAREVEDKKVFGGLKRRYQSQAAENEMQWIARIGATEWEQVVTPAATWVEEVASVRAPSSVQRNRQLQSSHTALAECQERRQMLYKLEGAMRRAQWLPAGRTGHMPDFSVAYHSPRNERAFHPSQPSRHSFVVAVAREGEESWIVDPLHL